MKKKSGIMSIVFVGVTISDAAMSVSWRGVVVRMRPNHSMPLAGLQGVCTCVLGATSMDTCIQLSRRSVDGEGHG